jgi:hypothetical protein
MADTGVNASFKLGAVTYDTDDCLDSWAITDAIDLITYVCGGYNQGAAGARTVSFSISLALAATDVAKLTALSPGTLSTTFEAHPGGDTATYIEVISTSALVTTRNVSAPANGIITADVTIHLNDVTFRAASS